MKLFKMHQIIKPIGPSIQLFIKITFAFMKIFDFLVKIAIFGALEPGTPVKYKNSARV